MLRLREDNASTLPAFSIAPTAIAAPVAAGTSFIAAAVVSSAVARRYGRTIVEVEYFMSGSLLSSLSGPLLMFSNVCSAGFYTNRGELKKRCSSD
jgi:hypothetical protein